MYREQMSKAGMVAVQTCDRLWSWQGDRLYKLLVAGLLGTLVLSAVLLWTGFRSPDDGWETVAGSRAAVAIESFKLRRLTYGCRRSARLWCCLTARERSVGACRKSGVMLQRTSNRSGE